MQAAAEPYLLLLELAGGVLQLGCNTIKEQADKLKSIFQVVVCILSSLQAHPQSMVAALQPSNPPLHSFTVSLHNGLPVHM